MVKRRVYQRSKDRFETYNRMNQRSKDIFETFYRMNQRSKDRPEDLTGINGEKLLVDFYSTAILIFYLSVSFV